MSCAGKARLRVVGGNSKLVPMKRSANDAMWPRLSVVGREDVLHAAGAAEASQIRKTKRPAWALMWLVGLAVATAQGITQAIASYW